MAKDPAFLFYASDFLTGTMFMSHEQTGKYIRLLCSQHQHGGLIDKSAFDALVRDDNLLRAKFIESENGFYNLRLSEEMEKRNKKSGNISEAAKQTWKKRKENNTIVIQSYNDRNTIAIESQYESAKIDTIVIRPENENENENENVVENKNRSVRKKKFTPPQLNEVIEYFKEKNFPEDLAKKAFEYYASADWHDGKGEKVIHWKQKMLSVWMREDNKHINNQHNNTEYNVKKYKPIATPGN